MKGRSTLSTLKLSEANDSREEGFTLIELLVVILIIGILSAIAIPAFMNQRRSANDAAVESDVKTGAIAVETFFAKNPTATTLNATIAPEIKKLMTKSDGVVLIFAGTKDDFCVHGIHPEGNHYRGWNNNAPAGIRPYYMYQSKNGGTIDKVNHISSLPCSNTSFSW